MEAEETKITLDCVRSTVCKLIFWKQKMDVGGRNISEVMHCIGFGTRL